MTRTTAVCDLQLLLPLDVVANNKNVVGILVRDRIVAEMKSSMFQMRRQTVIAERNSIIPERFHLPISVQYPAKPVFCNFCSQFRRHCLVSGTAVAH